LYQHYHGHVTQPLIAGQLRDIGIDISVGQISNILIGNKEVYHAEKEAILTAGLQISNYVGVDDTGCRHQGRNGYCTYVGNDLFAWSESTESKSRISFLKILRGVHGDYILTSGAIDYMADRKLPLNVLSEFSDLIGIAFRNETNGRRACRKCFGAWFQPSHGYPQ